MWEKRGGADESGLMQNDPFEIDLSRSIMIIKKIGSLTAANLYSERKILDINHRAEVVMKGNKRQVKFLYCQIYPITCE